MGEAWARVVTARDALWYAENALQLAEEPGLKEQAGKVTRALDDLNDDITKRWEGIKTP